MTTSPILRTAFLVLAALMMTAHGGFAVNSSGEPNTDLGLPTETPHQFGTRFGLTEADCVKSGGTVGVNSIGVKVCAKKANALLGGDLIVVKTPSQAIDIGRKHCALYHMPDRLWRARYEYGSWTVWNGDRTRCCHVVITVVTNDGRTPKECGRPLCPVPPPINVIPK